MTHNQPAPCWREVAPRPARCRAPLPETGGSLPGETEGQDQLDDQLVKSVDHFSHDHDDKLG